MTTGISVVRAKLILFAIERVRRRPRRRALRDRSSGSATPRSFNALVGIVWLAIVVTWGVRSVIGALLAGMIFAIAPQRLSIILILDARSSSSAASSPGSLLSKAYRKPLGALAMVALAVVAFGGSAWIWDNVDQRRRRAA